MVLYQFEDKKILVTGGVGSIGSEIVRQLLKQNPRVVRIFDNDETGLFKFQQELKGYDNVRFLIGDVRDKERLRRAVEKIDIIFHAAALKHVESCEYNPFEAIKTNVLGTQNIIEVSMDEDVEKIINISTDKAASPTGTMGATKLLAERLITAAEFYKGNKRAVFCSVRFGNVVGARGSVVPIFLEQIERGGPITVTNPEMTRFAMSIPDSVNLIFKATEMSIGGEVFILKMPVLRLKDLAEVMIDELSKKHHYDTGDIKIEYTGVRAGEKIHEDLMSEEESRTALESDNMFILLPQLRLSGKDYFYNGFREAKQRGYGTRDEKLMSKNEIRKMLLDNKLL